MPKKQYTPETRKAFKALRSEAQTIGQAIETLERLGVPVPSELRDQFSEQKKAVRDFVANVGPGELAAIQKRVREQSETVPS